jgi:hypothetical protein
MDPSQLSEPASAALRVCMTSGFVSTHHPETDAHVVTSGLESFRNRFSVIPTADTLRAGFPRLFAWMVLFIFLATCASHSGAFRVAAAEPEKGANAAAEDAVAKGERLLSSSGIDLNRNGQTSLSDSEAREIASSSWGRLFLADVTDISDEAIAELAKHPGGLVLRALPNVSLAAAKALSHHQGMLNIGGESLSDDVIELLSTNEGELGLNSLRVLSDVAAHSLARNHKGVLGLNGLNTLTPAAAKELASHQGPIGLWGISSLSPEAAAILAESARYHVNIRQRAGFTPETLRALSGHYGLITLGGLDLPQYFGTADGWQAESQSGYAARSTELINAAIKDALGTESPGNGPHAISDIQIGTSVKDIYGDDQPPLSYENDPARLYVPTPGDDGQRDPLSAVCVRVDSLTGQVISCEKVLRDVESEPLVNSIISACGKTPQEIQAFVGPSRKEERIRYTFQDKLVRVRYYTFTERSPNVAVTEMGSRQWAEANLRAYGNAFVMACLWAKTAIATFDGEDFAAGEIPPLPGTARHTALNDTHALFGDTRRAELLGNREQILGEHADKKPVENLSLLVAGVGKVDGMPVIIVHPLNSTVVGLRPILTLNQYNGASNILNTFANDLVMEVANFLAQAEFPPASDKISVFRSYGQARNQEVFGRDGVRQINSMWDDSAVQVRYEWACENGWIVRVTSDGALILFRQLVAKK